MSSDCDTPDVRPIDLVRYKWTVPIVTTLADEPRQFNELKRAVGHAPANVLSERLKQLETTHVVSRTVVATSPPNVRYALTDRGDEMARLIAALERL